MLPQYTDSRLRVRARSRVKRSEEDDVTGRQMPAEAADSASHQGALFDDAELRPLPADAGYRGPVACAAAGITYRQLDYWARTGLVAPTVRGAAGSGTQRLYSFRDILILRIVKRLIDTGVSLQNIRVAVEHLAARQEEDHARIT